MSIRALILVCGLLQWTTQGFAALTLQLSPADRPAATGATVTFTGVLTNTSATDKLFLNDIQATLTSGSTTLKSNAFFSNVPGILLPGESYDGPIFAIKLDAAASSANYTGSVTLKGGATILANDVLGSNNLSLLATPVEQWRYNTFGDAAASLAAADTADFDHDGASNLLEYALGMDATVMDRESLPQAEKLGSHLIISYLPAATDVTYSVEASTDLQTWSSANVELITIANPDPPGAVTYWYKTSLTNTPRVFLRLKVSR